MPIIDLAFGVSELSLSYCPAKHPFTFKSGTIAPGNRSSTMTETSDPFSLIEGTRALVAIFTIF
jgi:hypothetical protein